MSVKDTLVRVFTAGAILGLAVIFTITVAVKTGTLLVGAYSIYLCLYPYQKDKRDKQSVN